MPMNPVLINHKEAELVQGCIFILSKSTFKDIKEILNIAQSRIICCVKGA